MEDDEKKRKSPYKLKEEFPNTIKIAPNDEQPKAPAVEAPAEETPTAGQSEAPAAEAQEVETPAEGGGDGPKRVYKTRARKTEEIANDINANSDADFVQRLKDKDRKTIPNWENPEQVSTHKMSYAKQDGKTYVYPDVQNINGELHDFTNPEYGHDKWDALDSALKNGDAVQVRNRRAAERFTTQYKDYYPKGDGEDDESDSENGRTPLPEMPEQGDTSALQGKVETEQQPNGIDLSKREYGGNPETEARNRQFVNNADELEKPDESALSPLTQPKEGIDLSKREYPTDSDLTPEQVVSKYGGDAERLKEAGFNPDGTPLSVGDDDNDDTELAESNVNPDEVAEGYNPETDPNVQGIRDATATRKQGYDDYLNFIDEFYKKQEKYDRQRQERDSRNAFWRSIGEVGASLVNLLGVSGAFNGRNAYGRGAYSSMQKFDLTTPKLTDKMWADIDKRKEQMDALRQRQAENRLKLNEILAGGQEKEGAAKAQGQKAYDDKAYRDAQIAESKRQFDETMQYKREKDAADEKLRLEIAKIQADAAKEIQVIKNNSSGKWPTNVTKPIRYTYPSGDGTKSFDCDPGVVDTALQANFQKIADCLARTLRKSTVTGESDDDEKTFDSVTDYISAITNMPEKKRYKYEGDDPIERALYNYYKDIRHINLTGITKDKLTTLLDWARDAFMRTEESGRLIEDAVAPAIAVAQSLIAAYGGGDDTNGGIILPEGMDEETARMLGYIGSSNNQ